MTRRSETVSQPDYLDVWENEGGMVLPEEAATRFVRRIEADGSWTIYKVLGGAAISREFLTGMDRQQSAIWLAALNSC